MLFVDGLAMPHGDSRVPQQSNECPSVLTRGGSASERRVHPSTRATRRARPAVRGPNESVLCGHDAVGCAL
eukprot:scaffold24529_cov140-Isochrysis_galbana.AAC.6